MLSIKRSQSILSKRNFFGTASLCLIQENKTINSYSGQASKKKNFSYHSQKCIPFRNNTLFQNIKVSQPFESRSLLTNAIYECSPKLIKPYLDLIRFQRTIGTWLLFFPCSWSIAMAAPVGMFPDAKLLLLFGIGSFLMRSSGCIINDMWDKEFDKKVTRTASRPLATGALSQTEALIFLSGMLSCSLCVLLSLNWYSIFLGAFSMSLVVTYPLFKRVTYWPQLVLGATLNWGALLGWSAVQGECNWMVCLPLYMAGISWTLLYDTIYAHQDKVDDALIGVKSTALLFGDNTKKMLSLFSVCMITGLFVSGYSSEQSWPYYLSLLLVGLHLSWQIQTVNLANPADCSSKFTSNKNIGLILFFGILLSNLLKPQVKDVRCNSLMISEKQVEGV
ncbi:4-hydroxybenzoate polyprenyltransferase, mitochondrial [Hydra vulgaris]|uniref:4-hydroxybenzoate polyprenyltransferase, mitochondrial n=1 Tax=Hydra vulgaris TaxID=6087 RepID=A0ABM4D3F8_HYDVU